MKDQISNIINHIVLVLDASASMGRFKGDLVKVADNQIKYLARRSKELDQETRITVYTFATNGGCASSPKINCLIYDKDVLRMPGIGSLYQTGGMTPLVDATLLALNDLALTPEKYGQHSFLLYVLTDGEENASKAVGSQLLTKINELPDHWTVAAFVPNQNGVYEAKMFGFPKENIAVWDATTAEGVSEAGEKIRQTTENFMVNRTKGIRGSKNLFALETPSVSKVAKTLNALNYGQFRLLDVERDGRIDEFVESNLNRPYKLGEAYYQLMKPETIQPQKKIAILAKSGVYIGDEARSLLGLPDYHIRVQPSSFPDYKIFVQSTSVNRKLIGGTQLLILS
jgi:hypothetical protein